MTAVILKIPHLFKYPGLRVMSSEQIRNSFTNCPPCLLAEMAKEASLVAGPPKCYINRLEWFTFKKKETYTVFLSSCRVIAFFTITAQIHARSLANFSRQYVDRYINSWDASASEIAQFDNFYRKKQMNINFECVCPVIDIKSSHNSYFDNAMTKFMINNRTDA